MHDVSISNGIAEMFTAGEPAWHRLGANVSEAPTWRDASKLAHLEWTVSKHQLLNPLTSEPIPSFALLRDDTNKWLSTVGTDYQQIQNDEIFETCDALIGTGRVRYESAGALDGGRTVFCLARLDSTFSPVKGDKHETYLLFTDYRNGKAARLKLTTVRVVCWNTLQVALKETKGFETIKLRHTSGVSEKLKAAKSLLSSVDDEIGRMNDKLKKLVDKKVTANHFENVMTKLFPGWEKGGAAQNKVAAVANNFEYNDGGKVAGIAGSAYALLQSVTRFIDHQRTGLRVGDDTLEVKRAESAMFGVGDDFKREALDRICEAVGVVDVEEKVNSILNQISL